MPSLPRRPTRLAPVAATRRWAALSLRNKVAGEDAAIRAERIWSAPGDRWFDPHDPIWWVHSDASMFSGGIRALLLQSLHPLALAGVEEHSDYRSDPWTRVQNTSAYIAATTFGTIAHAQEVIGAVRRIHSTVRGVAADGRPYAADDPHLLRWVHIAEIESFLTTYQRYGARPLSQEQADTYVSQAGVAAELLGVTNPPQSEEELRDDLESYRAELSDTVAGRRVARFLLWHPPLPLPARAPYALLAMGAVATLPDWARGMLGVPAPPFADAVLGRPLGSAATAAVRWVMSDPSVAR